MFIIADRGPYRYLFQTEQRPHVDMGKVFKYYEIARRGASGIWRKSNPRKSFNGPSVHQVGTRKHLERVINGLHGGESQHTKESENSYRRVSDEEAAMILFGAQ